MNERIKSEKVKIETSELDGFFSKRAEKFSDVGGVVAMLYQDGNPDLAAARDKYEKEKLLEVMNLKGAERLLDVGCGVGRWTAELSQRCRSYLGVEPSNDLLNIAKSQFSHMKNVEFQNLSADLCDSKNLQNKNFDVILIAGVLHYVNDDQCVQCFRGLSSVFGDSCKIVVRVPVALSNRLTLKSIWSEELQSTYSAIYRTVDEYEEIFNTTLPKARKSIQSFPLYPEQYNNRPETRQHVFVIEIES